jgi:predicted PurR-regulated permease PerM
VATVALGAVGTLAVVEGLTHSTFAISLTLAALLLALAMDHAVQLLVRLRSPRWLAITTVVVLALALLVGIGYILIPAVVSQAKALFKQLPAFIGRVRGNTLFRRLDGQVNLSERLQEFESGSNGVISGAAKPVLSAVGGIVSFLGAGVTAFFLAVFMVIFGGQLIRGLLEELAVARREVYEAMLEKIYNSIGGYIVGISLICAINATMTTTFLAIDTIPFFLPLGIVSGLSSMIPYAGPFVTGTSVSLLAFATRGLWHGLACAIYFVVYGQLEGNILGPLIFRRTVRVNPLVVTLSVLFFGEIGGIPGVVVAVPAVAAIQIIVGELLTFHREKKLLP